MFSEFDIIITFPYLNIGMNINLIFRHISQARWRIQSLLSSLIMESGININLFFSQRDKSTTHGIGALPGGGKELSFVRNISPRGLLFHSKSPLEIGDSIVVELNLSKYGSVIAANVKIVHVEPLKRSGGFNVGGKFVDLDDKIHDFLDKAYPSEISS